MADLSINSTAQLNNGTKIPKIGFGVWASPSHLTTQSCLSALKSGYRHIDTAQVYGNEKEVGAAVKHSGVARHDVYITSKVLAPDDTEQATYQKCLQSVVDIVGSDGYLDLMLIHNVSSGAAGVKMLWQALERLVEEGKIKSIGVSNTGIGIIEGMKEYAKVWPPAVNQLELHPWCQQQQIVGYCEQNGITLEAYCPLVRNQKSNDLALVDIAQKYGKSTAQVLLRYSLQKGWIPLPKSDTPERIAGNADIFDFTLSKQEMDILDKNDEGAGGALVMVADNDKKT